MCHNRRRKKYIAHRLSGLSSSRTKSRGLLELDTEVKVTSCWSAGFLVSRGIWLLNVQRGHRLKRPSFKGLSFWLSSSPSPQRATEWSRTGHQSRQPYVRLMRVPACCQIRYQWHFLPDRPLKSRELSDAGRVSLSSLVGLCMLPSLDAWPFSPRRS